MPEMSKQFNIVSNTSLTSYLEAAAGDHNRVESPSLIRRKQNITQLYVRAAGARARKNKMTSARSLWSVHSAASGMVKRLSLINKISFIFWSDGDLYTSHHTLENRGGITFRKSTFPSFSATGGRQLHRVGGASGVFPPRAGREREATR